MSNTQLQLLNVQHEQRDKLIRQEIEHHQLAANLAGPTVVQHLLSNVGRSLVSLGKQLEQLDQHKSNIPAFQCQKSGHLHA
ncbi:hypothetical protein KDW_28300 [Dictyobacter vulcani]|uniref:Uncharacterized protein n=1 Tax=Dictyobacter vulcani TaxID=2607529 RepID=A0A5J4KGD7_9CHLR|nr:hypothetical protein [Dictyobacter vulcani]GER88668.1 hypothetical protein KDW_28300 [Dictyobacter vulcani]